MRVAMPLLSIQPCSTSAIASGFFFFRSVIAYPS
jgi:hypothetical protein